MAGRDSGALDARHPRGRRVARVISDVSAQFDTVGLTVAEAMPRLAIKLRNMLDKLPLLKE